MPGSSLPTCFIDSNIWLYAFIATGDVGKRAKAVAIINQSFPIISTQVINEVCVNLLKKGNFTEEQIRELVQSFYAKYRVIPFRQTLMLNASTLREQYMVSYWDSNIIAAALDADVSVLYSEDMHDGLIINNSLHIVNPFKSI